jgi:hypothetical protein
MSNEHLELVRRGVEKYIEHYNDADLVPADDFLKYDFDEIGRRDWELFGDAIVKGELTEATNVLNGWQNSLLRWDSWNRALSEFGNDEAWDLRVEFVESCAHRCLIYPSAVRDMLTMVATNGMHQVHLASESGYRDHLQYDPSPLDKRPLFPTRKQKEERLKNLMTGKPKAAKFFNALISIDDAAYRKSTFDYRNRSSHAIAPRLAIGITQIVTRSVVPAEELVQQSDGTFKSVTIPGKMVVQYGHGGTPPLDMVRSHVANVDQYRLARHCFQSYREILEEAMASMPIKTSALP